MQHAWPCWRGNHQGFRSPEVWMAAPKRKKKNRNSQALPGNTPCPMYRGLKIWGLKILCGNVHKGAQRTWLEGQCHAHVPGFLPPAFPGLPKSCASLGLHPAPACWGPTGLAREQGALRNRAARAGSSVCKSKKEKAAHCKLLLCKKLKNKKSDTIGQVAVSSVLDGVAETLLNFFVAGEVHGVGRASPQHGDVDAT